MHYKDHFIPCIEQSISSINRDHDSIFNPFFSIIYRFSRDWYLACFSLSLSLDFSHCFSHSLVFSLFYRAFSLFVSCIPSPHITSAIDWGKIIDFEGWSGLQWVRKRGTDDFKEVIWDHILDAIIHFSSLCCERVVNVIVCVCVSKCFWVYVCVCVLIHIPLVS